MRHYIAAIGLLLAHGLAAAGGYQGWQFGMTQAQGMAVGDPSRYYTFRNGDVGAGVEPFEGGEALLSFYFEGGRMERAMLIAYRGKDAGLARQAWVTAYRHLARICGEVESISAGQGASTLEAAMAAYDREAPALGPGKRHQIGCLHMPAGERVWASATGGEDKMIMVAVNYGKP
jgi:hypothetical protein